MVRRESGGAWAQGLAGRMAAGLLAVAGAALVAGCGDQDVPTLMETARTAIAKKEAETARISLKNVLQQQPEHPEARFLLGQLLLESGDAAGAEVELRRALDRQHPQDRVLPLLASALLAQNKGGLLLQQHGSTRLADAEADARLQSQLAAAEAGSGNLGAATERLEAVLRSRPDDAAVVLLRARLRASAGQTADALAQVEQLLASKPDTVDAWLFKGDLLRALAPAQAGAKAASSPAAAAYREALKRKPDSVGALAALVGLQLADGDGAAAEAQWKTLQKSAPQHPQTLLLEAMLAGKRGDFKHAREVAQNLLRVLPDHPQVLMVAGEAELQLGNVQQAEAHFAKAVQQLPGNASARQQLALAQLRSGQTDKALSTLAPLLDGSGATVEVLTLAAQAQLLKGDTAAADATFARAARLKPDDNRLRLAMALSAAARGKGAAALSELRAVAATDKGTTADLALVEMLLRGKDSDAAAKAVDALAVKLPNDALVDHLRGRVALAARDEAAARRHFDAALARQADYLPSLVALSGLDMGAKQPAAAKARFEAMLQKNPKNVGALLALAELHAVAGDQATEVARLLADAVAAEPANVTARAMLADHQIAQNQAKAAIETLRAGLTALPDSPELLDRLGRAQLAGGDPLQAISTFTKLAAGAPRSPLPLLRLADAQTAARNPAAAAAAVRKAAELAPDNLAVLQAQVTLALQQQRFDQALAVARKLQARLPDEALGYTLEGNIELRRRNWDAAADVLRKALARNRPGDAAQRLHVALAGGGKTAQAEAFAQDWRKQHPDDIGFLQHLGDQAMAQGRLDAAESVYREVVARLPQHVPALNNLAYVLATLKKPGAVETAEKALQFAPRSAAVMDTLALALAAEDQTTRAIAMQRRAIELAPDAHDFRLQYARLLLQSGDKSGARGELDTLAALGAKYPRQADVAALIKTAGQ